MASTTKDSAPSPQTTDADSPVADLKRKREHHPDLPEHPLSASRTTNLQKDILHVLERYVLSDSETVTEIDHDQS